MLRPRLENAECRKDPHVAQAFHYGNPVPVMVAACAACFDRPECLAWALEHEKHGFWGGHNAHQRERMRREYGITLRELNSPYAATPKEDDYERLDHAA